MRKTERPRPVAVGVLTKVLHILEALQASPSGLNLKKISERTGINASTAYRLLTHLEREGYLIRDHWRNYTFGMKLLLLGPHANRETNLREMASPVLRELSKSTGETVNLGVPDQGTVLYLDVVESHHEFRLVSRIGMRRPLYSTALGKALAAFLPAEERESELASLTYESLTPKTVVSPADFRRELEMIRRQGFSVDNEETVLGARCIAAPILNARQEALAAISVAGPTTRISEDKIRIFAASVMEASRLISARMGLSEPPASQISLRLNSGRRSSAR